MVILVMVSSIDIILDIQTYLQLNLMISIYNIYRKNVTLNQL